MKTVPALYTLVSFTAAILGLVGRTTGGIAIRNASTKFAMSVRFGAIGVNSALSAWGTGALGTISDLAGRALRTHLACHITK